MGNEFYSSIVDYYDVIFPYQPVQKDFVLHFNPGGQGTSLLDVGCGTGGLALALANHFEKVVGIDPDTAMLNKAIQKAPVTRHASPVTFYPHGMLDFTDHFRENQFDVVICLGNTLVHLSSDEEVQDFLQQARRVLKPGGRIIIQIINYDRILDQQLNGLPTIENEQCRFERIYHCPEKPAHIQFVTRLTIKDTGGVIENEVRLLALQPKRLNDMLKAAGFERIDAFGNFKRDPFDVNAQPYIVVSQSNGSI